MAVPGGHPAARGQPKTLAPGLLPGDHRAMRLLACLVLSMTAALSGCCGMLSSDKDGCQKDSDCKGDRVCVEGTCQDPPGAGAAAQPAQQPAAQPAPGCWVHEDCGAGSCEESGTCRPLAGNDSIWFGVVHHGATLLAEPRIGAQEVGSVPRDETVSVIRPSADNQWRLVRWQKGGRKLGGWTSASAIEDVTVAGGSQPPPPQPAARPAAPKPAACQGEEVPCPIGGGRSGWCKKGRCVDICPKGLSYSALDAQCRPLCTSRCKNCMFGHCMD